MKKIFQFFCLSVIFLYVLSAISFGAGDTISLEEAYKTLSKDKGKYGYIIGKFPMIHLKDSSIGNPQIVNEAKDINRDSIFSIRFELVNAEKENKKYTVFFKPVNGSETTAYYIAKEKLLEENTNDSYWIIKVPAGSYKLGNFLCSLTLALNGYHDFRALIFDDPMTKHIKKSLNIQVREKQILYIGDFNTTLITYICMNNRDQVYSFGRLGIDLKDNFEAVKTDFINGADDKLKEKIDEFQFVSAFQ